MSLEDLVRTKMVVTADVSSAKAAITDLAKTEQRANDQRIKGMDDSAKKADYLGQKIDGIGKQIAQQKIGEFAKLASAGVADLTGGVVDLNAAMLGFQAFGPGGAVFGAFAGYGFKKIGEAANETAEDVDAVMLATRGYMSTIGAFPEISERFNAAVTKMRGGFFATESALNQVDLEIERSMRVVALANEQLAGYNTTWANLGRTLGGISTKIPGIIGALTGKGLGVDKWSGPIKFQDHSGGPDLAGQRDARRILDSATFEAAGAGSRVSSLGSPAEVADYSANLQDILSGQLTEQWRTTITEMEGQPTILERMFGKPEAIDGYRESWSLMTDSFTAGYSAMVDGTESFSKAFKHALADGLKSLGSRMLIRSLEELAEGFASLANPFGGAAAALHFKSAAMFGAGAAAAGLAAHAMGSGGSNAARVAGSASTSSTGGGSGYSSPSSTGGATVISYGQDGVPSYPPNWGQGQGSPPGHGTPSPGTYSGGGGVTYNITYGDSFSHDSPRMRQVNARRVVALAIGAQGVAFE